jgi:hypothetical protein
MITWICNALALMVLHYSASLSWQNVPSSCMLVLRLCSVMVGSQQVVDTSVEVHDFVKTLWPQAYK